MEVREGGDEGVSGRVDRKLGIRREDIEEEGMEVRKRMGGVARRWG